MLNFPTSPAMSNIPSSARAIDPSMQSTVNCSRPASNSCRTDDRSTSAKDGCQSSRTPSTSMRSTRSDTCPSTPRSAWVSPEQPLQPIHNKVLPDTTDHLQPNPAPCRQQDSEADASEESRFGRDWSDRRASRGSLDGRVPGGRIRSLSPPRSVAAALLLVSRGGVPPPSQRSSPQPSGEGPIGPATPWQRHSRWSVAPRTADPGG